MDALELQYNREGFDEIARDQAPEGCIHCGHEIVFVEETECWFARDTGYLCADAPASPYSW